MPILPHDAPLPAPPRRIVVAGTAGAGKSTLARAIGEALGIPYVEIDGLHHGPGWTKRPSFERDVTGLTAGDAWVTEWQYRAVRPLLLELADLMVWLDLPRAVVMRQVVRRTLRRRLRREVLWNGNVEPPLYRFFIDREHIVRWAWSTYGRSRQAVIDAARTRPELPIVRLRSRDEASAWLANR